MQEENRRLIDEALEFEPVKNTFRLAWEFIRLNKNFTLTAMSVFVVLNLFAMLPIISLIFSLFTAVFAIAIQMHVGRTLYTTKDIENYVDEVHTSRIDKILTSYVKTAFGVYLGWMIVIVLFVLIFSILGVTTGVFKEGMNESDVIRAFAGLGLPLTLVGLAFSYVQPLVHSNIVLANSLGEGFKAVFSFFTKDVWSSAMKKNYFVYMTKVGLLASLFLFLVGLMVVLFSMIPVIGGFSIILIFMGMYLFMVFMSIISMMARRMIEE
ncbi:MAG: Unknown protein [uncultured Sulfurovum sp.]|uniref:Beta-carotene 15,15'-monooxygenase n=1 Tax=uncultured Sulfurovum sp. TaxID=269237 RepID=A0A6S6SFA4_9BACT|nr:MAG: Unknown protein [uncultured Sulfurovum sp.]